jgi:hypothetical protein
MEKIDFILAWVDGTDPKWIAEKKKYENNIVESSEEANAECRYRPETEMLRYWFRSVEKFAPWVNKIHFVTCGQKPDWLNINHPKLNLVNHKDYIPSDYLPTFNANTIEMNFHRIDGLSEKYVYFNDDMFLTRPVLPECFFKNGFPVLLTDLRYYKGIGYNNWSRLIFNDYCLVNKSFRIKKAIWDNKNKWFNVRELGIKRAIQNFICYKVNMTLPVGLYGHVAHPHLKSTLQEIWDKYPEIMGQAMTHKFRTDDQVNQWLLCAWNQAKGVFYPAHESKIGKNSSLGPDNVENVCEAIKSQQYPQICINDTNNNTEPEYCISKIIAAFETILPIKSSFEKT